MSCRVCCLLFASFPPCNHNAPLLFTDSCHDRYLLPTAQIKSTNKPQNVCSWWDGGYNMIKVSTVCVCAVCWLVVTVAFLLLYTVAHHIPLLFTAGLLYVLSTPFLILLLILSSLLSLSVGAGISMAECRCSSRQLCLSFTEKQCSKIHKQLVFSTRESQQFFENRIVVGMEC